MFGMGMDSRVGDRCNVSSTCAKVLLTLNWRKRENESNVHLVSLSNNLKKNIWK